MSAVELLIPLAEVDAAKLLDAWSWLAPPGARLVAVSTFADPFVVDAGGAVHLVDTLEGELRPVAADLGAFERWLADPVAPRELLLADTVELLHDQGRTRAPGRCYGWKVPPILGASLTSENVDLFDLATHPFAVSALLRATKGVP